MQIFVRTVIRDSVYYLTLFNVILANIFISILVKNDGKRLKEEVRTKKIRKVLINRADRIGDAVVSLGIIRALSGVFEDVTVLASARNSFVFADESNLKILVSNDKELTEKKGIFENILYFFGKTLSHLQRKKNQLESDYDLIIDLSGNPAVGDIYSAKYMVGPNRGLLSIAYASFYKTTFAASGMELGKTYKDMIRDCLGLNLRIEEDYPKGFSKDKKKKIMIFVGNVPERNIGYVMWKGIISTASHFAECVVADDPDQLVMKKLAQDEEIASDGRVRLIKGKRGLDELSSMSNESKLFIGIDGGAEHYLERFTNSLVIFTCGVPVQWRPYSSRPYERKVLEKGYVYEETTNSAGLMKMVLYRGINRKPCYELLCNNGYWKNFDLKILERVLKESNLL